jgi:hypothetical protein
VPRSNGRLRARLQSQKLRRRKTRAARPLDEAATVRRVANVSVSVPRVARNPLKRMTARRVVRAVVARVAVAAETNVRAKIAREKSGPAPSASSSGLARKHTQKIAPKLGTNRARVRRHLQPSNPLLRQPHRDAA